MSFDIKKIIDAWLISANPSESQKELAELRGAVCKDCESNTNVGFHICSECGCPIAKKIFTDEFNACPLGKWKEIDDKFFPNRKKNRTIC